MKEKKPMSNRKIGNTKAKSRKKDRHLKSKQLQLRKKQIASDIRKWDDPILQKVCEPVKSSENVSEEIQALTKALWATEDGIGLAGPQLGIEKRIFVYRPYEGADIEAYINPEITERSDSTGSAVEGCLSYPGVYAQVDRNTKVKLKWTTESGETKEAWQTDRKSICVQHEIDHLDGICKVGDEARKQKPEKFAEEVVVEQVALPLPEAQKA